MYSNSSLPVDSSGDGRPAADQMLLEVPARPDQISNVRRQVADFTRRHFWGADDADALLLALGEACNNAVNYGRKDVPDPRLIVSCERLGSNEMRVDVCNQGNGFYPDLNRMGLLPDADVYATSGRGFGLMMALVDNVEVLSDGESTTVRLLKSRTV